MSRALENAVRLRRLRSFALPRVSAAQAKPFGLRRDVRVAPTGRVYGVARIKGQGRLAAWLDDEGAFHTARGPAWPRSGDVSLAAHDEGDTALLALHGDSLWKVLFREGTVRRLCALDASLGPIAGIAYGPEDRILLLAGQRLHLLRRDGESLRPDGAVSSQSPPWFVAGDEMVTLHGGRLVVVRSSDACAAGGLVLYGFDDLTLRALLRVDIVPGEMALLERRVVIAEKRDTRRTWLELLGTNTLLAQLDRNPTAFHLVPVEEQTDDNHASDERTDVEGAGDEEGSHRDARARATPSAAWLSSVTTIAPDEPQDASKQGGKARRSQSRGRRHVARATVESRPLPFEVIEGALQITHRGVDRLPRQPTPKPEERALFGPAAQVHCTPTGRLYGVIPLGRRPSFAAWIEEGALHEATGDYLPGGQVTLASRPDGGAVLFGYMHGVVWELDFATGEAREMFSPGGAIYSVAYGPEGTLLVGTSRSLDVYRRHGEAVVLDQRFALPAFQIHPFPHLPLLLVVSFVGEGDDAEEGIVLLGRDGPRLRRLASVRGDVFDARVSGEQAFVRAQIDWCELLGLRAIAVEFAAKREASPLVALYAPEEGADEDDDAWSDADEAPEDFIIAPAPGRAGLRYLGRQPPLPALRREIPEQVRARFGEEVHRIEHVGLDALYAGWTRVRDDTYRLVVVDGERRRETSFLIPAQQPRARVSLSWDRAHALVFVHHDTTLWWVPLSGAAPLLVRDFSDDFAAIEDEAERVVYLAEAVADGGVLAESYQGTWRFTRCGDEFRLRARGDLDLRRIFACPGGRTLVVQSAQGAPLRVCGVYEDGLRLLATSPMEPESIERDRQGRIFIHALLHGWYEFHHLDEAWDAARRSPEPIVFG
ncbi:hypothetical protein [Chondromyces crocatus]|uniref:Uncharacterized protein n=1 Tax=Chondromyces crocatus TaxID=52 RepID=A0A0K1EMS1_CHOCO|nr:hypothetical protein [Chondromyces crocatus]AKT42195.1 uncharacterized protein CMC5_064180 [Chondromyces crocatus]